MTIFSVFATTDQMEDAILLDWIQEHRPEVYYLENGWHVVLLSESAEKASGAVRRYSAVTVRDAIRLAQRSEQISNHFGGATKMVPPGACKIGQVCQHAEWCRANAACRKFALLHCSVDRG